MEKEGVWYLLIYVPEVSIFLQLMLSLTSIFQETQKPIFTESEGLVDSVFSIYLGHLGLAINFITDDDKDNFMRIE